MTPSIRDSLADLLAGVAVIVILALFTYAAAGALR